MRSYPLSILIVLSLLGAATSAVAEETLSPSTSRLPNIKASLADGFFALAEQQARGVLRSEPDEVAKREATLFLAHALWGQKSYSEMIDLLERHNGAQGSSKQGRAWREATTRRRRSV